MLISLSRRPRAPVLPRRVPFASELGFAEDQDADDQTKKRGAFEQGGDDQHVRAYTTRYFRLPCHALERCRTDFPKSQSGAENCQTSTQASANAAARERIAGAACLSQGRRRADQENHQRYANQF